MTLIQLDFSVIFIERYSDRMDIYFRRYSAKVAIQP